MSARSRRFILAGLALMGVGGALWSRRPSFDAERIAALYAKPLTPPQGPLKTFLLGHSLVGRDMPAMLGQLAGDGHVSHSQLGWGTSLRDHWEPDVPVNGFDVENDHPNFRPAKEALATGSYGAVVLTEMVEIKDAIRYHDSPEYLALWAGAVWDANPDARIYLYETWHHTDDDNGWLARIDNDLRAYWQDRVKYPALAQADAPIHLIPAGQVMGAFVRAVEAAGGIGGITTMQDLFAKRDDGTPDTIHFNDLGAYLVALTHYAVLYHRDPRGAPHQLTRADGTAATAPTPQAARAMQETVWNVVRAHPETGVAT